ncbi:MAG: C25 family cysteine peptidase [Chloroflexota bacterium]
MNSRKLTLILRLCLIPLALSLLWSFPARGMPLEAPTAEPGPRLLHSSQQGITLEFDTPAFEVLQSHTLDGQPCQLLRLPGFASSDPSGQPELPVKGAMLGIPAWAEPQLSLLDSDPVVLAGQYNLCPAAQPDIDAGEGFGATPPQYNGQVRIRDARAYTQPGFAPLQPFELTQIGYIRSQKVAQVRFQPFQYDPVSGELRYIPRLRLRLDFAAGAEAGAAPSAKTGSIVDEGAFEPLLREALLNYETARTWRARQPVEASLPTHTHTNAQMKLGTQTYKLLVAADGLYRVSYTDLANAGANLSGLDPSTFQLFLQGVEQAIRVVDGGDGTFDSGDYLLFYGQKVDTQYTGTNVYWLTWGDAPGLHMEAPDGTPGSASQPAHFQTSQRFENNVYYLGLFPSGSDGEVWYWDYVNTGVTRNYTLAVSSHLSADPSVSVRLRGLLRSLSTLDDLTTDPQHTKISLNGTLIDDHTWPDGSDYTFDVSVLQSTHLLPGNNTLSIQCPADFSGHVNRILVNWFEIEYWHTYLADGDTFNFAASQAGTWKFEVSNFTTSDLELYDISDPNAPQQITGYTVTPDGATYTLSFEQTLSEPRRYLALPPAQRLTLSTDKIVLDHPSELHSASNGADYLIISHANFLTAMQPLADYRAAQGLRTMFVDVQDIYDEFSSGLIDAQAIHDFLAYAYANWTPSAPAYVLLVGDGHFDPRNYFGTGEPTYIPPYLAQVDPWLGETAAENRFVTLVGGDNLPDMYLGRFPVKTSAQASAIIAKILDYEAFPPANRVYRVLFVADNEDSGGFFDDLSEEIVNNSLPGTHTPVKIYWQVNYTDLNAARTTLRSEIDKGVMLVNYIGHASLGGWGSEQFISVATVSSLNNASMLPFMLPMTCLEGSFHYPSPAGTENNIALAEKLLREPGKGSIGGFSPTGYGVAQGHDFLNRGLYQAIFDQGVLEAGPATTYAKLYLFANSGGEHHDLLDTYALIGDPALRFVTYAYYLPTIPNE